MPLTPPVIGLQKMAANLYQSTLVNSRVVTLRRVRRVYDPNTSRQNDSSIEVNLRVYRGNIPADRSNEQSGMVPSARIYYLVNPNDLRDVTGASITPLTVDEIVDESVTMRILKAELDARFGYWKLECVASTNEAPTP